jgi:hypothetical protein
MFTKIAFALAIVISTASGALAATNHRNVAPNHDVDGAHKKAPPGERQDLVEFVVGNMLFVGFHELGHALVGQLRLPILGRAEAAADSFATLTLLEEGSEFSINVLVQTARAWFLMDRRDRKLGDEVDFHDAHDLPQQRAFQIICLMVGSDEKQFKELADWVQLPEDRRQSCREDYENAKYSWDLVLKPHLRAAEQPKSTIEVVYEEGRGKPDTYGRSLHSIGFLEALAEYASRRYVLPRPITLVMKSCGDANASWDPLTLSETLCHEIVEDFVELHQGYTQKATSQKKTQSNELMARNVRRLRPSDKASMGGLEINAGSPESPVNQLQRLAADLKIEAAVFFTRPANK